MGDTKVVLKNDSNIKSNANIYWLKLKKYSSVCQSKNNSK